MTKNKKKTTKKRETWVNQLKPESFKKGIYYPGKSKWIHKYKEEKRLKQIIIQREVYQLM